MPMFGVIFEMNLDLVTYDRTVYSFLQWVSELGGLYSALFAIFSVLMKIIHYKGLDFYVVSNIYTRKQILKNGDEDDLSESESGDDANQKLDLNKVSVIKSNMVRFSPCKSQCRKLLNEEENLFPEGLDRFYAEYNLGSFLACIEKRQNEIDRINVRIGRKNSENFV